MIFWFIVGIVVAACDSASLVEYLTIIAFPSLPALLDTAELAERHIEFSRGRQSQEEQMEDLRQRGDANEDELRKLQDNLFDLRRNGPLVPEWFYKWIRDRYEEDMKAGADDFSGESP